MGDSIRILTKIKTVGGSEINITNSNGSFNINSDVNVILPNINKTDSDGTVTSIPSMEDVVCTPALVQSGIRYHQDFFTFQLVSYLAFDDVAQLLAGTYNTNQPTIPLYTQELDIATDPTGLTLLHNNEFGNKLRLTTITGVIAIVSTDYVIDHLTNLAFVRPTAVRSGFDDTFGVGGLLDSLNTSGHLGFNDYFVPNYKIIVSISTSRFDNTNQRALIIPFMAVSIYEILSSNTAPSSTSAALRSNRGSITSTTAKSNSSNQQVVYCRFHY